MAKRFNIWFQDDELQKVKEKAQKEKRTTSDFIRIKALEETPNLAVGNWWDDTDKLRKLIKEIKKSK